MMMMVMMKRGAPCRQYETKKKYPRFDAIPQAECRIPRSSARELMASDRCKRRCWRAARCPQKTSDQILLDGWLAGFLLVMPSADNHGCATMVGPQVRLLIPRASPILDQTTRAALARPVVGSLRPAAQSHRNPSRTVAY